MALIVDNNALTYTLQKLAKGDLKLKGTLTWTGPSGSTNYTGTAINTNNGKIAVGEGYLEYSSDIRLKQNINDVCPLLNNVLNTKIKTFEFKSKPDEECLGIIAQEVLEAFKGTGLEDILVKKNTDGYLSINETKFVYVVWEAFKEYVSITESRLKTLEEHIKDKI